MERIFRAKGAETELVQVGAHDIRGCVACGGLVVARRGGLSATFDEPNKFFTMAPTVPSAARAMRKSPPVTLLM